jgi:4'-phosphopantetheinyl transferase
MRIILGRYLGAKPAALQFERGAFGKPFLPASQNDCGLRFNLSHSHELALLALTRGCDIGIDIELIDPAFTSDEVARHFFSRAEIAQLESLPPDLRANAFFTCWTRKEAYIKARGEGLSLPLHEFDVSLAPESACVLVANRRDPEEVSRWSFRNILAGAKYAAALAIEKSAARLQLYDFAREH